MNYVCLSPNFPPNYVNFSVRLRERGANVLGIGSEPYDRLGDELKSALTEYYRVDDLENYDELHRACGFFIHKYGRIDRIESHNEHWLAHDARLRTDFNVFGFKEADLPDVRNKSRMKAVFQSAGVPVARGEIVHTEEDARRLISLTGYPVCVKPDCGVGASSTYKIHSDEELRFFFSTRPSGDFIMEEFIEGRIETFDGLTDAKGKILLTNTFVLDYGIMEMVNYGLDTLHHTLREIPGDVAELGARIVKAFGIRERFFHIEFFRTREGLVALEINARPPGGWCIDMINYASDGDVYDQYAMLLTEGRIKTLFERPYHVFYAGLKEREHIKRAHSREDILARYGGLIVQHGPIDHIFSAAMGDYAYLLRSPDLAPLKEAAAYITHRA